MRYFARDLYYGYFTNYIFAVSKYIIYIATFSVKEIYYFYF